MVPSSSTGAPGCQYCAQLRSSLGSLADDAQWVNIWQDPQAAEFVRSVNAGNEVVPTVVFDGIAITNPPPAVVRDRLEAASRPDARG
ncbi:glutaredoxin domain-containing protein [Propionibacteriaceae bacterium G1746]